MITLALREDDLVVGVARSASRATVYRHLHVLEASKVVESILPETTGGSLRVLDSDPPPKI